MLLKLVRKGLVELISANFMMQFVGFGLLILIPRFVSEADVGTIRVLQTYTDLLVVLGGLGMNTAILKLCSDPRPATEKEAMFLLAVKWTAAAAFALVLGVLALVRVGLLSGAPDVLRWLPGYALIVPFAALAYVAASYLQALKRIREMARAQFLVKIQSVAIILLATWQYGLSGFVLSSVVAFGIGLWPFVRIIGTGFLTAARIRASETFRVIAGYSVLGNAMNTLGKYADLYILGLFAPDPIQLGYYSLATIFVIPGSVVTSSIQTIATPYLSEGSNDRGWFGRSLLKTQVQTVGVAIMAALGVRVLAELAVEFLYEPGYQASLEYLNVLLVFYVLRSGYAVTAAGHIALGLTKYNFIASTIMALLALSLSYVALDQFGFVGVAWAKVLAAGIMIPVYALLARRAIRVAPTGPADTQESDA